MVKPASDTSLDLLRAKETTVHLTLSAVIERFFAQPTVAGRFSSCPISHSSYVAQTKVRPTELAGDFGEKIADNLIFGRGIY